MTQEKMSRLQLLFEKTVADYASKIERKELQLLYLEYINFGRTQKQKQKHLRAVNH